MRDELDVAIDRTARALTGAPVPASFTAAVRSRIDPAASRWPAASPAWAVAAGVVVLVLAVAWWTQRLPTHSLVLARRVPATAAAPQAVRSANVSAAGPLPSRGAGDQVATRAGAPALGADAEEPSAGIASGPPPLTIPPVEVEPMDVEAAHVDALDVDVVAAGAAAPMPITVVPLEVRRLDQN